MLKKLCLLVFAMLPFIGFAQSNPSPIPIPMKNGIIWYEKSYSLNTNLQKPVLFKDAVNWFKSSFTNIGGELITADDQPGEINGEGVFKVPIPNTGNYYWLRFTVDISLKDNTYTFTASHVYEKPIEVGVSNEFSKIEYRWWDFRRGKPWGAEDEPLFKGLDSKMNLLMDSLYQKIGKQ